MYESSSMNTRRSFLQFHDFFKHMIKDIYFNFYISQVQNSKKEPEYVLI